MNTKVLLLLTMVIAQGAYAPEYKYKKPTYLQLLVAGGAAAAAAVVTHSRCDGVGGGVLMGAGTILGAVTLSQDIAYRFSGDESVITYATLAGVTAAGVGLSQPGVPLWGQTALITYLVTRAVQ